ncbi:class I SAM-dependent methyltransferase [Cohnella faecalis]|uniref:class I SAM-dependent methyltransferase n=1 Tax=Cohnella faecalis TaxID=2315694 RepID=UPI00361A2EC4
MTNQRNQKVHWAAQSYDEAMGYISKNGESLFEWLNAQPGERIVDFGCGTGELAARIAESGVDVEGVDISPEMIERAKEKFPHIAFTQANVTTWRPGRKFDAVFSNAALHWMKEAEETVRTIGDCLEAGGRFVAEFGGVGNVASIIEATKQVVEADTRSDAFVMPWYFPTVGEYAGLLERHGFEVRIAMLIDRPTRLNGEEGMAGWLRMFGTAMIPTANMEETERWITQISDKLKPALYADGNWMIPDYRRLRILAVKKN